MSLPVYKVRILPEARADIAGMYRYIAREVFMPEAANRYAHGIYGLIRKLSYLGGVFAVSLNSDLQRCYGPEVRTVAYRKMTIIYNITGDMVIVRRVIAGSLVV
jgi:plasmid stabilization system protein ParE